MNKGFDPEAVAYKLTQEIHKLAYGLGVPIDPDKRDFICAHLVAELTPIIGAANRVDAITKLSRIYLRKMLAMAGVIEAAKRFVRDGTGDGNNFVKLADALKHYEAIEKLQTEATQ